MISLANKLAAYLGRELGKNEDEIEVMAYGFIGIIQMLAIYMITSVISLIFGFFWEATVVFLSVGFLRRLTGGAHSQGIYNCLVYSVVFICLISSLARFVLSNEGIAVYVACGCAAVLVFGYVIITIKAPIAPPNKPCRTEEKRRRLRRGAFLVLTVFALIVAVGFFVREDAPRIYSLSIALALSTLWQLFMMTPIGFALIRLVDGAFGHKSS